MVYVSNKFHPLKCKIVLVLSTETEAKKFYTAATCYLTLKGH